MQWKTGEIYLTLVNLRLRKIGVNGERCFQAGRDAVPLTINSAVHVGIGLGSSAPRRGVVLRWHSPNPKRYDPCRPYSLRCPGQAGEQDRRPAAGQCPGFRRMAGPECRLVFAAYHPHEV
ncbi:MAG: hypothetical protein U5K69_28510 [Balneolaceae bacterium]|nr:hypothetical protein [Balneolaceae bacterium]